MTRSKIQLIVVGLALAACGTPRVSAPGQPHAYTQGMEDGCASGYVAAGHPYYRFTKNVDRYGSDSLYRQGWDDGLVQCKGRYEAFR